MLYTQQSFSLFLHAHIWTPKVYSFFLFILAIDHSWLYTVKKEMKCRGDSEIKHKLVRDTTVYKIRNSLNKLV